MAGWTSAEGLTIIKNGIFSAQTVGGLGENVIVSYRTRQSVNYTLEYWLQRFLLAVAFFLPLSLDVTTVCLSVSAALWLGKMVAARKLGFVRTPFDGAIVMLVAVSALSIAASPEKWLSFYNYYHLMGRYILIYYIIVNNVSSRDDLKRLATTILCSALVVTMYGFYQYIHGVDISTFQWVDGDQFPDLTVRVFSTLQNPNLLAGFLVVILSLTAGLGVSTSSLWEKLLFFILAASLIACLILTYSRGAWISVFAVIAVFGLFYNRKIFWVLALLPVAVFLAQDVVLERLTSIMNPTDTSSTLRLALWESTLAMIMDKPFAGIGWGAYRFVYPEYDFFVQNAGTVIYHAHNMYLHIAAEIGIPGLMAFLYLLYGHIRTALAVRRVLTDRWMKGLMLGIAAALSAIAVNGITDYIMFSVQMSMLFWLLNACIIVCWRYARKRKY